MRTIKYDKEKCKVVAIGKENILIEYKDGWEITEGNKDAVKFMFENDGITFQAIKQNKRYWFVPKKEIKLNNCLELE